MMLAARKTNKRTNRDREERESHSDRDGDFSIPVLFSILLPSFVGLALSRPITDHHTTGSRRDSRPQCEPDERNSNQPWTDRPTDEAPKTFYYNKMISDHQSMASDQCSSVWRKEERKRRDQRRLHSLSGVPILLQATDGPIRLVLSTPTAVPFFFRYTDQNIFTITIRR